MKRKVSTTKYMNNKDFRKELCKNMTSWCQCKCWAQTWLVQQTSCDCLLKHFPEYLPMITRNEKTCLIMIWIESIIDSTIMTYTQVLFHHCYIDYLFKNNVLFEELLTVQMSHEWPVGSIDVPDMSTLSNGSLINVPTSWYVNYNCGVFVCRLTIPVWLISCIDQSQW